MSETAATAPSGWYDDGSGTKRWWDGNQWGDYAPPVPVIVNVQSNDRTSFNGAAIGGFIVGLISLLVSWIPVIGLILALGGVLFSGIGLYLVKQRGAGRGLASAGMVLSVVSLFIFFLMLLLSIQS